MDGAHTRSRQTIVQGDADKMSSVNLFKARFLPSGKAECRGPGYKGGCIRAREEEEVGSRRVDGDDIAIFLSGCSP